MSGNIVALLSDFGSKDAYVGVMKAVILGVDPSLTIVDLCHEIPPHDLLSASYVLYSAWDYFPDGSVFCAVVDPGVGSGRGTLLAEIRDRYLVGPDNGLISLLVRLAAPIEVYALNSASVRGPGHLSGVAGALSSTFHGRDLFAPAAAMCARGEAGLLRGGPLEPHLLAQVYPSRKGEGLLHGHILHVDRFGNCISSLHRSDLASLGAEDRELTIRCGSFRATGLLATYSEAAPGEPLCLIGSSGFLEIAVREGNAAAALGIGTGHELEAAAGTGRHHRVTDSRA